MVIKDIFALGQYPERLEWKFFRPGVDIYRLYDEGPTGSSAALLKYAPGATVPKHEHTGYEHIVVLSGTQRDHNGNYGAGTLVVNEPGTQHSIVSESGCIVFIVWEKPVAMRADKTAT